VSKPTGDIKPEKITCVPRRHLSIAAFKTYDAMCAMVAKNPDRICWAPAGKLANWNDRSPDSERSALTELEREGWIIPTHSGLRRKSDGNFTSNEYRVLTHEEFVAAHPGSCPAPKYDERTGRPLKRGRAPRPLERINVRKILESTGVTFEGEPTRLLDFLGDRIHEKKSSVTENPATEKRKTVTEESATEKPTVTDNPVTTVTESSVTTVTENPVTSSFSELGKESLNQKATIQPSITKSESERTDGRAAVPRVPSSLKDNQWDEFLKRAKEGGSATSGWVLYGETEAKVRRAVKEYGVDAVLDAVEDWAEERRPPVSGLDHPWPVFLREAEDDIREYAKAHAEWKQKNR